MKSDAVKTVWESAGRGLLSAALSLGVVAALEGYWMSARAEAPALQALILSAGLLAPLALALGLALPLASYVVCGEELLWRGVRAQMGQLEARARSTTALFLLAGPPLFVVFLVSMAGVSLGQLASEETPAKTGALLGASAALHALFLVGTLGAWSLLRERSSSAPSLPRAAALGVVVAAGLLGVGVAYGSTSGESGGLLILGVLRRPELDLSPLVLLLLLTGGAVALQSSVSRVRPALALILGLGSLVLGLQYAARASFETAQVERAAPLGRVMLAVLQKLSDSDDDGFSGFFGGHDCAPRDPESHPGADDRPGNGKDEDCSGADEPLVLETPPSTEVGAESASGAAARVPKDLNVLLITVDTLRADLGFLGYPRPISPNLDALARRSTVFQNAYALASYTPKSMGPMLIGKYSSETHRGFSHFNMFGKEDTFLQERLQKAGIRTVSVQCFWYLFAPNSGFERGFHIVDSQAAPKTPHAQGDRSVTGDRLTDRAIALLDDPQNTRGQFFFWVHYVDPHSEYVVHDGFDFGKGSRDAYDSEVAFVDHQIGRLLDHLAKTPLAERTAVIVTSDHGEAFGEHGMIRHGFELWEELLRVPLIVYVPGAKARRVVPRRSLIGLVPTVLELVGSERPSGQGNDFISGVSWLSDVYADESAEPPRQVVFADMSAGPHNAERQAFIDGDLKLTLGDGRPISLFDLAQDPGEREDLKRRKDLLEDISGRYTAFKRRLRPVHVRRP